MLFPYFTYGANLSYKHLTSLGVKWDKALPAVMNNYRVVFNKKSYDGTKSYANIEPALGHKVYGVVYYGLTEDDYLILDKKEGVAYGHYTRESMAVLVNDKPTLTYVYVAQSKWIDKESKLKPSKVLFRKIVRRQGIFTGWISGKIEKD